ncbi:MULTISPECIES: YbbR-like domain-containing protein [Bacillaceae]|uniref:CdaR family protein n=1 Tax=Bacillaceae TaxID=186817 RepID=UPI00101D1158|nr:MULTISPECIES: CdaR family protein [Bacillus]MCA1037450.1 YbbR-like domain-containing protein [Bacillus infantis]MDW2879342.1 CdaR family protein [Bacillus infantis]RYI25603.1 YbbR-like domain-containing protein [Bacillus infantis]
MDKLIDKLVDNRWFMKAVALVLALLLFDAVYDGSDKSGEVNVPGDQDTELIEDVPVKSYYDTDNLVVTGVPDTVDVRVSGPKSHVQIAKTQRDFEVYVNLSDAEVGEKQVRILVRDISDRLDVTVDPLYATVSIQEKVTKEFKVEPEFNQSLLGDGFTSGAPSVKPETVKITGAKDVVDRISYVKAALDVKGPIEESVTGAASIRVLDRDMNKLNVAVDPETVEVTVSVKSLAKTVPIDVVRKGSLPSGVTLNSIDLDTAEARITGSEEALGQTERVRVEIDLGKITKDGVQTLPVIIPDGITSVDPKTVEASVDVTAESQEDQEDAGSEAEEDEAETATPPAEETEKDETKTFSNLPIDLTGAAEGYTAAFADGSGRTNLSVQGPVGVVNGLGSADFNIFVDASSLSEGEHNVPVKVTGPDNVSWKLSRETVKISITQKNEEA